MELQSKTLCFDGEQRRYKHNSEVNKCEMNFSIYLPPSASKESPVPLIYWLSGLTCTDENFVQKAGAQQYAAKYKVAIVCPDTSPRGESVPDDAEAAYDLGLGAGFYVDAQQAPWKQHYNMYSYVTKELPSLIANNFPEISDQCSIMGHSMGGHGALTIALKNPTKFKSVSAFAPICSPIQCPWGLKALSNYLGEDKTLWHAYDACELITNAKSKIPLLIDQGTEDNFLSEQLKPGLLETACKATDYPLTLRFQTGYDHSYFFIASFIEDHIKYHATQLSSWLDIQL